MSLNKFDIADALIKVGTFYGYSKFDRFAFKRCAERTLPKVKRCRSAHDFWRIVDREFRLTFPPKNTMVDRARMFGVI